VHGNGLDYFDGRHFTHFPPNPADPVGLADGFVVPVLLDPRGMLWLGTVRWGLVRFDTHTRKFTTYPMDPKQPGNQAVNWTEDAYSDGTHIWVASPTGLFRFDPATGKFSRHYTEKDGLASNTVVAVLGDAQGNLWIGTVNGLSKLDPRTETFRNYDRYDGLQGNAFFVHCHATARDGRLFFGGSDGLSAFYPNKLADNPTPPPVVLTEFELFNKPAKVGGRDSPLQQAINVASSVALRYDQSVFSFQFAALNYDSPQKNKYAYKLEAFDRDWQFTDATRRLATYTNLDPGDYTFRVKASNNDGVWNEQGVALHLTILPPWWKTNWFRALCAAAFLLLLWTAYQLRVRQLAHQFNVRLEERVNERTRIARDLHDTLLQSFHGVLLYFQTAINQLPEHPAEARTAEARKTLERAMHQAKRAIVEGREAIQGLRSSVVERNDLALAMRSLGEELAANANSVEFQVHVEGSARDLHPILRDEVYRVTGEAIRNAFRHSEAKQIEVEIHYDERRLRVRVRDNGKGIDPKLLSHDGRERHFGLRGMRERAKLIGGKLTVWSELDAGTEVELSIPAARAYKTATDGQQMSLTEKVLAKLSGRGTMKKP
jgi:signal transduction histidine kinase